MVNIIYLSSVERAQDIDVLHYKFIMLSYFMLILIGFCISKHMVSTFFTF